jgi:hypothetical protein
LYQLLLLSSPQNSAEAVEVAKTAAIAAALMMDFILLLQWLVIESKKYHEAVIFSI